MQLLLKTVASIRECRKVITCTRLLAYLPSWNRNVMTMAWGNLILVPYLQAERQATQPTPLKHY